MTAFQQLRELGYCLIEALLFSIAVFVFLAVAWITVVALTGDR